MKLYEISNQYQQAFDAMTEQGVSSEVIEDTLADLADDFTAKGLAVAAHLQNIEADITAIKEAEKRMAERRKVLENQAKYYKDYLVSNMVNMEVQKIECAEFRVSTRKPPKVAKIENSNAIPSDYLITKEVTDIDKKAILKDLKAGKEIPGAKLDNGNYGLTIK